MAYLVTHNRKLAEAQSKKTPKQAVVDAVNTTKEKSEVVVSFVILWTAIFWYYFFSGLYMLLRKRLPNGWKRLRKQEVAHIIVKINEFLPQKKQMEKYGRVVDIDYPKNTKNLLQ